MRAASQDGSYPRSMLCRDRWADLDGDWDFAFDDDDEGLGQGWFATGTADRGADPFDLRITVPYPPEAPASRIGERGYHPVVWYRRTVSHDELVRTGLDADTGRSPRRRVLVHFGAVDFRAQVWFDGQQVASHAGGQTPFTADITAAVTPDVQAHRLVVRAEDDPLDVDQPRGKQDWRESPHRIWYERTTGIWQTVWAEVVPADHVTDLAWSAAIDAAAVRGQITLARMPPRPAMLEVRVRLGDDVMAEQWIAVQEPTTDLELALPALRNGQDRARLLWSPEHPVLFDVEVVLRDRAAADVLDTVTSYFGLRTVSVGGGCFLLNEEPYYQRAVLNQGYRPHTHLATRGTDELRREVEMIKEMGFNAVRVHQKAEDPRFLYWADRLGLLVWGETAAAYAFSPRAVSLLMTEWVDLVRRDRSHPAVVVWVPLNESWGVQDIALSPAQRSYARALAEVTRALDPTRPVMTNEGWEHLDSDILGVHDYATDPDKLRDRYTSGPGLDALRRPGPGPAGRRVLLPGPDGRTVIRADAPLMITEFGGVSMTDDADAWGYAVTPSGTEYAARLQQLFDSVRSSSEIAGFCYTQYMDTGQETNGLLFADGTPKLPIDTLREIVTGDKDGHTTQPGSTFGSHD